MTVLRMECNLRLMNCLYLVYVYTQGRDSLLRNKNLSFHPNPISHSWSRGTTQRLMEHCPSPSLVVQWQNGLAKIKKDIKDSKLSTYSNVKWWPGWTDCRKVQINGSKTITEGKKLYAPKTGECEVMADGIWLTKYSRFLFVLRKCAWIRLRWR